MFNAAFCDIEQIIEFKAFSQRVDLEMSNVKYVHDVQNKILVYTSLVNGGQTE